MTREEKFMPGGVPKHVRCYDNGGKSVDRYTVVFTGNYKGRCGCDILAMSSNPFHPQGVGMHENYNQVIDQPRYSHLGKKISFTDLPQACQISVIRDYKDIWRID